MGAEVFTYLRWPLAQPRADAAQLSGRLCLPGSALRRWYRAFPGVTPVVASGRRAAPVLGVVAGREARGLLAPSPESPANTSRGGRPQPKTLWGGRIYQRGQGKQLGLPLTAAERQRQINCGRPGLLPPLCPAPPYGCRQLCPVSIRRCFKKRGGCSAYRFPPCPADLRVGIPAPHGPRRILPRPHLAPAQLSGQQSHRHVVCTCVPVSPCQRTNGSFGFGLILLKGKATNEGLALKPFPAAHRSSARRLGAADLVRFRRSIICFSRGNPAELRSASGALLPRGEDVTRGRSLWGRRELAGLKRLRWWERLDRASLRRTPKPPAEPRGARKRLALAGHEVKSTVW